MQHRETGADTKQYKKTALRAVKIRRYMQKYHAPIGVRSQKNEKNSATKKKEQKNGINAPLGVDHKNRHKKAYISADSKKDKFDAELGEAPEQAGDLRLHTAGQNDARNGTAAGKHLAAYVRDMRSDGDLTQGGTP